MKLLLSLMLALALLVGPIPARGDSAVRIMIATDLHYLAPILYEGSDLFLSALRNGDGKITQESPALLQGLLDEARHQQPDALLITGDLSFNGERESHEELASALRGFSEESGIPVWVIPGNHDILNPNAHAYFQGGYAGVANITEAEFGEIYAGMCLQTEGAGYSGLVRVGERAWLALLDVGLYSDTPVSFGVFRAGHETFLRQALAEAEEAGALLVTATHQSLVDHTDFNAAGFDIWYADAMKDLLRTHRASAHLHLSGHIHAQHIVTDDGLTDAATGALSVSPHLYGMVTVAEDGTVRYEAQPLCAEHLPDGFHGRSREWFRSITIDKERASIAGLQLDEERAEALIAFAADFNAAFFGGTLQREREAMMAQPAYADWVSLKEQSFFGRYIELLMNEAGQDGRVWENRPAE